jgi:predicted nucleic acid-binding protein
MRTRLFDASAIIMVAKNHPVKAQPVLEGEHLLDLTSYEVGNALRRINELVDETSKSTALEAVNQASPLLAQMEALKVDGEELGSVMEVAFESGMSFYDSSCLQVAGSIGLTLVTEDANLLRGASRYGVQCLRVRDLAS